ncbi:MAG: hypothetical protein FWH01_04430 [Oscillospiraceae bacterium]|nr:hypothetical protein [Oscillospiraceae bacterium]
MRTTIIRGVANTAPFSSQSFGYYMAHVMPLMSIALIFGLWTNYSPAARWVGALTAATPGDGWAYALLKCGAALTAWLIVSVCTILFGMIFLIRIFGDAVQVGDLLLPCAAAVLPPALLIFAAALLAGRAKF